MTSYPIRDISLARKVERMKKDLQQMKSLQYVGRRLLATKRVESNMVLSHNTLVGANGDITIQAMYYYITFKAQSQLNPYARLTMQFYNSNNEPVDNDFGLAVLEVQEVDAEVDNRIIRWRINVQKTSPSGPDNTPFRAKMIVYATDDGTISNRRVSL